MKTFRTEIGAIAGMPEFDYSSRILLAGSCFSDEIGARLKRRLFDVAVNPFGPLFNPISMAMAIDDIINNRMTCETDFFRLNDRWVTFSRHSRISAGSATDASDLNNSITRKLHESLPSVSRHIFTFGSAIAWHHNPADAIVANCHKQPGSLFSRIDLSIEEITERWTDTVRRLLEVSPGAKIIFTVSPVRHIGYGLTTDRLSKSRLIESCHRLCELFPDSVSYFPSYEILTDELRDYRFYAADMVHPSETACDYIYDKFAEASMQPRTSEAATRFEKLTRRLLHRYESAEEAEKCRAEVGDALSELCLNYNIDCDRLRSALDSFISDYAAQ